MSKLDPSLLCLRFIPLSDLLVHEEDDPYRVKRLVRALQHDGKLKNPPVVAEVGARYVVLDGATRTSALQALEMRDAFVQIVDYYAESVTLSVWYHVVVGITPNRLLAKLAEVKEITVQRIDMEKAKSMLDRREIAALIVLRDGKVLAVICEKDVYKHAEILCRLVSIYRGKAQVHRTTSIDLPVLTSQYPDLTAIVAFPCYKPDEIIQLANNGTRLPMGITRHIIAGRALGLDIPLSMLSEDRPLEEKNAWLEEQIRMRLRANKIRLYQEPVFIFDD